MKLVYRSIVWAAWLLIGCQASFAQLALPLELRQVNTIYNFQGVRGVPISSVSNAPPGSDGRMTNYNESFNSNLLPTTNQFQSVLTCGSTPGLTLSSWLAASNSIILQRGTNPFNALVATEMRLPVGRSNRLDNASPILVIQRRAQIGRSYLNRQISFLFGSVITPPDVDENGVLLTNISNLAYWLPEPYSTNNHTNATYYWSPNARQVFAIQSGPIAVTWKKTSYLTSEPADYSTNSASYSAQSGNYYRLYTARYIISGSAIKTPRKLFWTEREFRILGKPVAVPTARVGGVAIVYNNNFPKTVDAEYRGPGYTSPTDGTTNAAMQELRTLWYDQTLGNIYAFNQEGRVFLELLGDLLTDGRNRQHLGFEIVDVFKQATPVDLAFDLGEQLLPSHTALGKELYPEPVLQSSGVSFAYQHNKPGSDRVQYFATRETMNLNDYLMHWLEEGLMGLRWPYILARYQLVWPEDVSKYSHYVRPDVATENEARQTAIALPTSNAPYIEYQDALDYPRAKFTEDFKFYTFLDAAMPAHRTLLRLSAGEENVAFERVYSWLDASLKTTNLINSVATNLTSWNPTNLNMTWNDPLMAPRVVSQTIYVGDRLAAPSGELGAQGSYRAGYINQQIGTLFNINAYVDPFVGGFDTANLGAIIPINAIPGTNLLEVWWFRTNSSSAGPNAGNVTKGFATIYWPAVIGRYTIQWPQNPAEIVLASKLGSGSLNPYQTQGRIYYQNQPSAPGYNPNEEHAIMSAGVAYATRDDLNITNGTDYSSAPFVLVEYQAADDRPEMLALKVLREKPEEGHVFDYIIEAGKMLQAPMPLPLLGQPITGSGDISFNYNTEPDQQNGDLPVGWDEARDSIGLFGHYKKFTFRDRKHNYWVYRGLHSGLPSLQAGTYVPSTKSFAPLTTATAITNQAFRFAVHASRQDEFLLMTCPSNLPTWLKIEGLTLLGTPASTNVGVAQVQLIVEDMGDQSRVTNNLTVTVAGTGTMAAQSPLQIASTNSYTGAISTFSNRPPFLAYSPGPSNCFTMRYYYKTEPSFAWPGISPAPGTGSIVPYLRPYDTNTLDFAGHGAIPDTNALQIVYRPVWPVRDPKDSSKALATLPFGATLAEAKYSLPGVRGMKTVRVLYQQSIATNIVNAGSSVVLHDATREKIISLTAVNLTKLPGGVVTDYYQGKLYFPNLPPHLSARLYYDPNRGAKGSLVFKGVYVSASAGESYMFLNVLRDDDLAAVKALCPDSDTDYSKWTTAIDSLSTKVETFYENPARPGTYIPETAKDATTGIQNLAEVKYDNTAVDSYALSATGPGGGYVTLIEANGTAFTQPGDPVSVHIFKVGVELYTGEIKIIPAGNPLSELVTFLHSADLAGRFSEFEYEWKIAAPVDGTPPTSDATMSQYLGLTNGAAVPRYTLGGAGIRALGDNYLVMRYRPINPQHPLYNQWSSWTSPQLAEGWIKRVLAGINPFNQRINDLFNNRVNTDASILTQAGHRWEGDVALNMETINDYGLIEIYETVLRRGRMLSIESGYNYGPANDALLLAAGYLNDLYMMLGNEALADASNPTIGIGTKDQTYGEIATALFAFKGQTASLLEEELALLRGRDDFMQPGVEIAPGYNRLFWNYTRGIDSGEVIYALNYNIQENPDTTSDGIIDAEDAQRLFPQGHGDAYGHYLTALKGYYSLLMNSCFDWVPRTEAVTVLGQPVQVDYQDERKFTAAAVAVARAGRQVFDLTWRKDYQSVKQSGWHAFEVARTNSQRSVTTARYWGMDHWANRTYQGAYLNWIVGNAMVPELDTKSSHEGIQKIDRTTVPELQELCSIAGDLQTALDNAENGLSPLGLPEGGIAFDINPSAVVGTDNGTHFEQIYQRAKLALVNAVAAFDDAKDVTRLMRSEQDSLAEFQAAVAEQEIAYNDRLVEIYGSPYPDDKGPGKTYNQDYTGPDLIHYSYVDTPELTFSGMLEPSNAVTFKIDIQDYTTKYLNGKKDRFDFIVQAYQSSSDYLADKQYISFTLDSHGFFMKPQEWTSKRYAPGKVQEAIARVILARNAALKALSQDELKKFQLDQRIDLLKAKIDYDDSYHEWDEAKAITFTTIDSVMFAAKMYPLAKDTFSDGIEEATKATLEAIPDSLIFGLANGGDTLSGARSAILAMAAANKVANSTFNFAKEFAVGAFKVSKEGYTRIQEATVYGPMLRELENKREVYELELLLNDLQTCLFTINEKVQELDDALRQYRTVVANGDSVQLERQFHRQRSAAVIQGFRTRDAAFRIFRNEKLERYKTLFDLSARYTLLAANAYDYETGLLNTAKGRSFKQRIINSRALGVVRNSEPQYAGSNMGDPGLSSVLAEMKADWDVLRGRLGFNNPDAYGTTASLRMEHMRILPGTEGDDLWTDLLQASRMNNILEDQDVRRFCMQIASENGLPVPGIVLSFSTTIAEGYNLFGRQLAAGDHAFSKSSFATKIFGVGVALEGYKGMDNPAANSGSVAGAGGTSPSDPTSPYLDPLALAATPYIYLIPVGVDSMRSPPLGDTSTIRTWRVDDIAIPMPFNIGGSAFSVQQLYSSADSLTELMFATRKHQAFRPVSSASVFSADLYGNSGTLQRTQFTNNRLVGRSVWNSRWKIVIPGSSLLNDPNEGLDRFMRTVKDVKLHFVTYSYSGN